jgi:dynein intermediate chain 2
VSLFSKHESVFKPNKKYFILQINTECASTENRGVYHKEGGWPRDVNPHESDQTARYRKKIEKDEAYSHAVLNLGQVEFA